MSFKPTKTEIVPPAKKYVRGEFEAPLGSDDEDNAEEQDSDEEVEFTNKATSKSAPKKNPFIAPASKTSSRYQPFTVDTAGAQEEETANPWLPIDSSKPVKTKAKALVTGKQDSKSVKNAHKHSKARQAALDEAEAAADPETARVTIDTNLTLKISRAKESDDEASDSDDEAAVQLIPTQGANSTSQRELVKMAFAGDNVVREFKKTKKQVADEDDDQVIDNTLPGWGSWAGTGLSRQQKANNKRKGKNLTVVKGIAQDKRKDRKLGHVIINEKRDKKVCGLGGRADGRVLTSDRLRCSKRPSCRTSLRPKRSTSGVCGCRLARNGRPSRRSRRRRCRGSWSRRDGWWSRLRRLSSRRRWGFCFYVFASWEKFGLVWRGINRRVHILELVRRVTAE